MLQGKFVSDSSAQSPNPLLSFCCSLFLSRPKVQPLLPSSSPSLHSLSLFSASALMGPHFPPLTLLTTLCLSYPPPALSIHTCWPAFFHTHNLLLLYALRLQYFHSQITQKCSVIVPVSAILPSLPLSLSLTPPFSRPAVWLSKQWTTTPLRKMSGMIHKQGSLASKFKIPLIRDLHPPIQWDTLGYHLTAYTKMSSLSKQW